MSEGVAFCSSSVKLTDAWSDTLRPSITLKNGKKRLKSNAGNLTETKLLENSKTE